MASEGKTKSIKEEDVWEMSISVRYLLLFFVISTLALFCCVWFAWNEMDDGGFKSTFGIHYYEDEHSAPQVGYARTTAQQLVRMLGEGQGRLFALLDRDWNGLISLFELEPLIHHIRQDSGHPLKKFINWVQNGANCVESCTKLHYRMKVDDSSKCRFLLQNNSMAFFPLRAEDLLSGDLVGGNSAAAERVAQESKRILQLLKELEMLSVDTMKDFDWKLLGALLPAPDQVVAPGLVYPLIRHPGGGPISFFTNRPDRLAPGYIWDARERDVHLLLRPLHPQLFVYPRAGSQVSIATVRAVSKDHLDISFRLHVDFQLASEGENETAVNLSPSGLEGRMVVRRDLSKPPLFFKIVLAADGELPKDFNAAVEWPSTAVSGSQSPSQKDPRDPRRPSPNMSVGQGMCRVDHIDISLSSDHTEELNKIEWTDSISPAEALNIAQSTILPHRATPWMSSIADCLSSAAAEGKPIHAVVAFGALPGQATSERLRNFRETALEDPKVILRMKYDFVNCWLNMANAKLTEKTAAPAVIAAEKTMRSRAHLPVTTLVLPTSADRVVSRFLPADLEEAIQIGERESAELMRAREQQNPGSDPRTDDPAANEPDAVIRRVVGRGYVKFLEDALNKVLKSDTKKKTLT